MLCYTGNIAITKWHAFVECNTEDQSHQGNTYCFASIIMKKAYPYEENGFGPLLHDGTLNIDYLPEEIAYSINTIQCDPVYKKYADGNNLRQFMFSVESKEAYGSDVIQNIENSGFYQRLEEWVTNNNIDGILPELEGYTSQDISCTYNGSLMYNDVNLGVYQIQFRLLYI